MSTRLRLGRKTVPLTVLGLLVTALMGTTAAVAYADEGDTIGIRDGNVPTTAADFETPGCDQVPGSIDENEDGWVFVLPGNTWQFMTVTATFTDLDGATQVREGTKVKGPSQSATSKFYVITPAGWTLTDATATIDLKNDERPGKKPTHFNLTHTCAGTPVEPDPDPSSPTSGDETPSSDQTSGAATTDAPGGSETGSTGGSMPVTGFSLTLPLLLGLGLVVVGAGVVYLERRRRILAAWNHPTDLEAAGLPPGDGVTSRASASMCRHIGVKTAVQTTKCRHIAPN